MCCAGEVLMDRWMGLAFLFFSFSSLLVSFERARKETDYLRGLRLALDASCTASRGTRLGILAFLPFLLSLYLVSAHNVCIVCIYSTLLYSTLL